MTYPLAYFPASRVVFRDDLGSTQIDAKQGVALDEPRPDMTLAFTDQNIGDKHFGRDQVAQALQSFDGWALRLDHDWLWCWRK
jgi:hypothetical protein